MADNVNSGLFNAANFRTKIRDTMIMGMPPNVADRATFRWTTIKTYNIKDPKGKPYDYSESPATVVAHPDVQVPVAVELSGGLVRTEFLPAGEINDKTRVTITVLDVDYDQIEGADECLLGGNTYHIDYVAPPIGLFSVEVRQIFATATDES